MRNIFKIAGAFFLLISINSCSKNDDNGTKDGDGNTYNMVTIGTQVWLKENLKTTKFNDGSSIPLITDNNQWKSLKSSGYCWYMNDMANNKETYGALYNWYSVSTGKLCPIGWHVPSRTEWTTLIDFLGGLNVIGGKLKETGTNHWESPNKSATNESGFTSLPGGLRQSEFYLLGFEAIYWSSTESGLDDADGHENHYRSSGGSLLNYPKNLGVSIRCIKDN